jgi:hypothetical protein
MLKVIEAAQADHGIGFFRPVAALRAHLRIEGATAHQLDLS